MIALINTVSPLTLDERMLDCLMLLAEYGQPAILCPASNAGSHQFHFHGGNHCQRKPLRAWQALSSLR